MVLGKGKAQAGFTLIELLAVMAILGILGGLVAGTVVGLGTRGQETRLDGDREGIGKAANAFALEAFPEAYPIVAITSDVTGNVSGVHEIDFKTGLPQDPNKTFVPNFLSELPDSAALINWRIDTNSGNVFFAQDGSALIKPSNNRLDISTGTRRDANAFTGGTVTTVTNSTGVVSDYLLEFSMAKNEAAPEIIEIQIPAGYSVGGGQAAARTVVGMLSATLDTDNPVDPGQVINFGGVLVTSGDSNEWLLIVDYNDNKTTGGSSSVTVKTASEATRVHTVSIVSPTSSSAGTMTINISRGNDIERNLATETWQLTLLGSTTSQLPSGSSGLPFPAAVSGILPVTTGQTTNGGQGVASGKRTIVAKSGSDDPQFFVDLSGSEISSLNMFTNPSDTAVYRWLAEEHTTISPVFGDTNFFSNLPGTQGVLIK